MLTRAVEGFLVTRQIFAGAGKFALEEEDRLVGCGFQLAQRSDFFSELQGVDTMQRRPIINTRDEPHADPLQWRRFHVILGDANMSPFATWLKVGTTALVLEAIVAHPRADWPQLAEPLGALRHVSRDPTWRWELRAMGGGASRAVDVQSDCLRLVEAHCDLTSPERAGLVAAWREVLEDLEADPMRCRDRLDWVAKLGLIREFQAAENIADDDPWLRSLDLEYHRLDPVAGLYYGLEQAGVIRGVPEESLVERAVHEAPRDTRAAIRGGCIAKFRPSVVSAQWDHVTLATDAGPVRVDLTRMFDGAVIRSALEVLARARTPGDLRFAASGKD